MDTTIFKPGLDWKVGPEKLRTGLKFGFLSIEDRAYVAILWTPKIGDGPHSSCRISGKNCEVQPLSNFFYIYFLKQLNTILFYLIKLSISYEE